MKTFLIANLTLKKLDLCLILLLYIPSILAMNSEPHSLNLKSNDVEPNNMNILSRNPWYKFIIQHCHAHVNEQKELTPAFDSEHVYLEFNDPSVQCLKALENPGMMKRYLKNRMPSNLWIKLVYTHPLNEQGDIALFFHEGAFDFFHALSISNVMLTNAHYHFFKTKRFDNLKEASFINTNLNGVPEFEGSDIQKLTIQHNPLKYFLIFKSTTVEYLDISNNNLKHVPFFAAKKPLYLNLMGNKIQNWFELPNNLKEVWVECEYHEKIRQWWPNLVLGPYCNSAMKEKMNAYLIAKVA